VSALGEETRKQETSDSDLPPSLHSGKPSLPKEDMPWAARLLWGSPLLVALASAVGGCLLLRSHTVSWLAPAALVSSALFFMFGSAILLGAVRENGIRKEETNRCADDCEDLYWALSRVKDDTLKGLAWLNLKQLRTFTVIAQRQTRMSYYASITAAAVAFLVLTSGAAVAIGLPTTAAKITAGTLATVGTVLSGFLAKTFLRAYQIASRQMSYYYGQPLVHCYLLHAEWLALEAGERFGGEAELDLWHEVIDASIKASAHAQDHLLSMQDINAKRASRGL
jgi:Cyanobacterial TRADD-N associated 2-Transmembrane domain